MKKILALAMVLSVLGSIIVGCSKADDSAATTTGTTAATAGATAGTTGDAKSTTGE